MKLPMTVAYLAMSGFLLSAEPLLSLPKLVTVSGKEYSGVQVTQKFPDGVKIVHDGGVGRLKMEELPSEVITQLGGFNGVEAKAFRQQEAKDAAEQRTQALRQVVAEKLDKATWEPYTSIIAKESANVTDAELLAQARQVLATLKAACEPLIEAKTVTRAEVAVWSRLVSQGKICKGMPGELVLIAWGQPESSSSNSFGTKHWHYSAAYVTLDQDGIVDYYSVNR